MTKTVPSSPDVSVVPDSCLWCAGADGVGP